MAVKLAEAYVQVSGRTGQFTRDIDTAQSKVSRAIGGLSRLAAGIGLGLSVGAIVSGANAAVSAANIQIQAEQRLQGVLKATGNAAGFTADELKRYASDLQAATTTGDEAILDSMSILGTFKSISGDVFKSATEIALDLSNTGFGSVTSATQMLGKALEDPIRGLTAMRRVGVTFSEQQQEQIKNLVKSGDLLSAQRKILEAVAGQVGGVSRELAKTDAGKLTQLRNILGDIKERIGNAVIPAMAGFVRIQIALNKAIAFGLEAFNALNKATGGMATNMLAALPVAAGIVVVLKNIRTAALLTGSALRFALISTGVGALVVGLGVVIAGLIKIAQVIASTRAVQDAWNASIEKFKRAWELLKESVGVIIGNLVAIFNKQIGGMANSFSETVAGWIERLADFVLNAAEWFRVLVNHWDVAKQVLMEGGKGLIGFLIKLFAQLPEVWAFQWGLMLRLTADAIRFVAETVFSFFDNFAQKVIAIIEGADIGEIIASSLDSVTGKAQKIGGAFLSGLQKESLSLDLTFPEENARRIRELMGGLVDEKKALEMQRKKAIDATQETPEGAKQAVEQTVKVELESGFLGFADLNKKMQDLLFKQTGTDATLRTASATEAIRDQQKMQLDALQGIQTTLSANTVAVATG